MSRSLNGRVVEAALDTLDILDTASQVKQGMHEDGALFEFRVAEGRTLYTKL